MQYAKTVKQLAKSGDSAEVMFLLHRFEFFRGGDIGLEFAVLHQAAAKIRGVNRVEPKEMRNGVPPLGRKLVRVTFSGSAC